MSVKEKNNKLAVEQKTELSSITVHEKGKKCCGDCKNGKTGNCHNISNLLDAKKPELNENRPLVS